MKIAIIIFGLIYLLGLASIQYLDKKFGVEAQANGSKATHILTLVVMWLLTPVLLLIFLVTSLVKLFRKK